jgi:hypothetical protein
MTLDQLEMRPLRPMLATNLPMTGHHTPQLKSQQRTSYELQNFCEIFLYNNYLMNCKRICSWVRVRVCVCVCVYIHLEYFWVKSYILATAKTLNQLHHKCGVHSAEKLGKTTRCFSAQYSIFDQFCNSVIADEDLSSSCKEIFVLLTYTCISNKLTWMLIHDRMSR